MWFVTISFPCKLNCGWTLTLGQGNDNYGLCDYSLPQIIPCTQWETLNLSLGFVVVTIQFSAGLIDLFIVNLVYCWSGFVNLFNMPVFTLKPRLFTKSKFKSSSISRCKVQVKSSVAYNIKAVLVPFQILKENYSGCPDPRLNFLKILWIIIWHSGGFEL